MPLSGLPAQINTALSYANLAFTQNAGKALSVFLTRTQEASFILPSDHHDRYAKHHNNTIE